MTEKRFERIYADVDVFCRDHNAKEVSQLIERDDYDRIVDLLNKQHEQIERLKENFKALDEVKCELAEENEQLKQQKDKWKQQCIHFKEMLDDMDIAYLCDEWIYGELKGDLE